MTQSLSHSSFLVSRHWLQFASCAAPVAWGMHGLSSVLIVVRGCHGGHGRGAGIAVRVLTIVFLIALAALGTASFVSHRRLAGAGGASHAEGRDQNQMLALMGVLASVAFAVGILWDGLPAFLVTDLCEVLR